MIFSAFTSRYFLMLLWLITPFFASSQIIFEPSPSVFPRVCIEVQEDTAVSGSSVALGLCDYDGSSITSTNDKVIFFHGNDGFIRTGSRTSSKCIGPSMNDFFSETNENYLMVSNCTGDHMRFVRTSSQRRIQSIIDPNYCVVALPSKEGYINQGDKIAIQDCTNVRDPWRPSDWLSDRRSWPTFIAVHSETFFAGDSVIVSYILPFSAFENNIGDYNITIVPEGEDLATGSAVFEVPACPNECNSRWTFVTAGNVTFDEDTVPIDIDGAFVAVIRIGQTIYASSSPFTLISKSPTTSPVPSESSKPSLRPSISSAPSQEPSSLPTFAKIYCNDVTVELAFTELASLIPGIILSILAVAPVFIYMKQNRTGGKFLLDVFLDIAEKVYTITTVIATLNSCLFNSKGARDGDSYRTFVNALILGVLVLVEFIVGVLGYFCCAESSLDKVGFDSGKFVLAERWCNGWALAWLLLAGGGLASFYQIYDLYIQDEYEVDTMEVVVTTILMVIGILPPLLTTILPTALCCGPLVNKQLSPGAILYESWRWYKLLAGDVPGLVFSFLAGDFLAFSWTAELVADILHCILNYEVLGMGE